MAVGGIPKSQPQDLSVSASGVAFPASPFRRLHRQKIVTFLLLACPIVVRATWHKRQVSHRVGFRLYGGTGDATFWMSTIDKTVSPSWRLQINGASM